MAVRGFVLLTVLLLAVNVANPVSSEAVSLDFADAAVAVSVRHDRHSRRLLTIKLEPGSVRSETGTSRLASSDRPGHSVRVAWLVDLRRAHSLSFEPSAAGEDH